MRAFLLRWSERFAAFGGLLLVAAVGVTLVSVIGADLFGKPLLGDTEIVELLMGVAVACFMPYCQMRGANVIVDFFTMKASQRTKDALDAIAYVVFAVIVAVLAERMIEGGITQFERERVSMFLRIPQWWGYAGASVASLLWLAVCAYTAWERFLAFVRPAAAGDGPA
jgi:TRAP-type C4-dicarboxylate transport system permease small subunit